MNEPHQHQHDYETRTAGTEYRDYAIMNDRTSPTSATATAARPKPVRAKLPPRLKSQPTTSQRNGLFGQIFTLFTGGH